MACYFARTTSRLVDVTSTFSPFSLAARYHHRLQHDLRLPQYLPTPYIDPRSGMARNRALVGMDLSDEETPQNSLLAVLLDASLGDVGCFKGISKVSIVWPWQKWHLTLLCAKQPCLSEASAVRLLPNLNNPLTHTSKIGAILLGDTLVTRSTAEQNSLMSSPPRSSTFPDCSKFLGLASLRNLIKFPSALSIVSTVASPSPIQPTIHPICPQANKT